MNKLTSRISRAAIARFALIFGTLLGPVAFAQRATDTEAPNAEAAAAVTEEVVTLPDFQVSAQRDDSWGATQAMSGTRTVTPIIELPYQVEVLTKEFLEEFNLFSVSDQLSFFSGFSASADQADASIGSVSGGSTLRGYAPTITRDGFRRAPPPQMSNTARVEVINGPISTLYGDAAPGGLINYISKRPTTRPRYSLTVSAGSYDFFRTEVEASGPLYKKKLFYLVSADYYSRDGETMFTKAKNSNYLASLLFKPFESTSITASYEITRLSGRRAASVPLLVLNPTHSTATPLSWSGGIITGYDMRLADMRYSRYGPDEKYTRNYDGFNVLLEHAYGKSWKQRVAYQGQWKSFDQNFRTASNVSSVTNRMTAISPRKRFQDIDTPVAAQTDLLGTFETGAVKHQLLFTADYEKTESRDRQLALTTAQIVALPDYYRFQDPFNPNWTPIIDYNSLSVVAAKANEDAETYGFSASERASLANGRVLLMGTVRRDRSKFAVDTSATTFAPTFGIAESTTHSLGVNIKLAGDALVAFANQSTSFNVNPTVDRNAGTTIPNEEGAGVEFGFKSVLLANRLGLSVSVYNIERSNIGQRDPDFILGGPNPEYLGTGKERVKGVDGNITYEVSKAFTLRAAANYLESEVVASTNASLVGRQKALVPRFTSSFAARYKFSGRLAGFSVGVNYRYIGGYVRRYALPTALYEESEARQPVGASLAYSWKRKRLVNSVRFTANNLFDDFYIGQDGNIGLGRQLNLSYSISFR